MDIVKILAAAIVGTSLMSLFSYALSEAFNKLYKEPVLLNYVFKLLGLNISKYNSALGWVIHYLVGLIFVIGMHIIWTKTAFELSWQSGFLLGMLEGIIGILGWIIMFSLPANRPVDVHYSEYYLQLFFAHIVFALGVTATYILF